VTIGLEHPRRWRIINTLFNHAEEHYIATLLSVVEIVAILHL